MTDPEFMDRAEALLKSIELACDRINDESDADIDNQRTGGMITLTTDRRFNQRIGVSTTWSQVSHRKSALNPLETLESPPLQPGSPPGLGVQERDLR